METTISTDGTDVRGYDQGSGPAIVMLGPGLDDGTRGKRLATTLAGRFRVLRLRRRQYRLDLGSVPCSIAQEVEDVLAVAGRAGEPVVLYGHSSGGVVALEAMAASPPSFAGAVIFEPPVVTGAPLGGEVITQARDAIAAGKPGTAMAIFMTHTVGLPSWQATLAGKFTALMPRYRRLVPGQINDLAAIDELGVRLDTYAKITAPTVLLGGDRSPAHLADRLDALNQVMPRAERVVMSKRDHGADVKATKEVARIIETLADKVLPCQGV